MKEIRLNGSWELRDMDLGMKDVATVDGNPEKWISTPVPGDIHQGLIAAGRIKEPLEGLNSFDCQWTENRSWWFMKKFSIPADWLAMDRVEVELNGLDANASIFLNETLVGRHLSSFFPFVADVKKLLKMDGDNVLIVRLTAGVDEIAEADVKSMSRLAWTEEGNGRPERGEPLRIFVRKPQYSFGWDWSPRVVTTAITGDVILRAFNTARIQDMHVQPQQEGSTVWLNITVTVDFPHFYKSGDGEIKVTITDPSGTAIKANWKGLLRSGLTYVDFRLPVKNPQLWWPNDLGDQPLYTAQAELTSSRERSTYPKLQFGIRFVELDTKDKFALIINGRKVFCKGANWIPADTIYARVTDERYDRLLKEARAANFNMLRVWGGGLYESEAFYRACDKYGIMVFHDFMFACSVYPDHLVWFRELIRREAEYQTVRLRNHPSIVLWCGNNECTQALGEWFGGETDSGSYLYNYLLPEVVRKNCQGIPYWNGSPSGGEKPNDAAIGDRHHWADCMMNSEMEKRVTPEEYDKCTALFVSEYGYIGAPPKDSVAQYLNDASFERQGKVWQHHNNTFEKNTVDAGIRKHYADPENISIDDYFLYSGLCQGLMYGYSLESLRFRSDCHGGLFWMYEDCWGEIGWTIIDYFLRRKIAWYFVKRAFAPVRLILRRKNGAIRVIMANDTLKSIKGTLEFGRMSFDGAAQKLSVKPFTCPPNERKCLATFRQDKADPTSNLWMARVKNSEEILPAIFRAADFRQLRMIKPTLSVKISKAGKGHWKLAVTSDVYAHAVCLNLPKGAVVEDNYFDLLAGQKRTLAVVYTGTLTNQGVKVSSVS